MIENKSHWTMSFLMSDAFMAFLNAIPEAAILSTPSGNVILTNTTAQALFQYTNQEFKNCVIEDLVPSTIKHVHPNLRDSFFEHPTSRYLEARELALAARKRNGSEFPMESALFAVFTEEGPIAINLIRDITLQKQAEQKITEYAFVDTLTNLPNHRYFDDHIKRVASKAQRDNANIGILYIDFDKFKPINDQYGHAAGDLVLHEISTRLSKLLRAEDLLARVGGDEFILTIHPLRNHEDLDDIAKRILIACHEPIITKDNTLQISASIGIATNQSQHFDEQELIQAADKAMYAAKKQGGNCFIYAVNP